MELGSKPKRSFKLKSSKQKENELRSWFDSNNGQHGEDDNNFGTFYKPDGTKTPVGPLRESKTSSSSHQNLSPQFRVGWNDGSQKNICDVGSPVSAISARRKIRRCPENLLSKISPPVIKPEEKRNNEGNSCDILQCINWAKSLIGPTIQSSNEEEPEAHDKSISEITESIKDTSLDLALDDSSNEMMILCSQAIEESVSSGKLMLDNKKPESEKHHITPNRENPSKRFKPQLNSNNDVLRYVSNFDRRLNSCDTKLNATSSVDNLSKQCGFSTESIRNDLFHDDVFKRPNQTSVNNNHANYKNFNNTNSKILETSCQSLKENEMISPMTISSSISDKTLSASSNDDIISHLDDEDDIFSSLDFNFLDSIQNKTIEPSKPTSKPVTKVIKPQTKNNESITLDTKPLVTKYTKQEIEKRRQEAKKRLLFNKKHRSM